MYMIIYIISYLPVQRNIDIYDILNILQGKENEFAKGFFF